MSKMPGPYARPSSSRHGIRASVPRGHTVSTCPRSTSGAPVPGKSARTCSPSSDDLAAERRAALHHVGRASTRRRPSGLELDEVAQEVDHASSFFGATVANASSTIPASSSQSTPPLKRTPSQPRWPTYGGRKKRPGSAATSSSWFPGGAAHQMREVAVAVMVVEKHHEALLVADEEARGAMARPLARLGEREAELRAGARARRPFLVAGVRHGYRVARPGRLAQLVEHCFTSRGSAVRARHRPSQATLPPLVFAGSECLGRGDSLTD